MKWFKHYSDSLDDPFIQGLIDQFGASGYMMWFGLIEIIAKESNSKLTGKIDIDPIYLCRKLRRRSTKVEEFLRSCSTSGKLLVTFSELKWNIEIPKMLELKDNYTKDLQATSNKLSPEKEKEKEKEKDYSQNSCEVLLSELLFSLIILRDEKHKKPNIQKWAIHIGRLIRIDKRSEEEIMRVIKWSQQDDFWQNNILSTEKLRKQYGNLILKMNRRNSGGLREVSL